MYLVLICPCTQWTENEYRLQKHCIRRGCHVRGLCDVRTRNWEYIGLVRVHGWEVTGLTAVPVHFQEYKVGKTRVTGCLERGIKFHLKL